MCDIFEKNFDERIDISMIKRVIWIILDSVGIGELPDAAVFGDVGANTLGNIARMTGGLNVPNMTLLGLGNIDGAVGLEKNMIPQAAYGKAAEISCGKDTTTGHWEMAGIWSKRPFPTYPEGFSDEIITRFIEKTGVPGVLGNKPASGTVILQELGEEHKRTGKPIVYTSADSVFQIACHEDIYSPKELYKMCQIAREILSGDDGVARVIARPFVDELDEAGNLKGFKRTSNRRDFSLKPPVPNLLTNLADEKKNVIAVGKIEDIFAGVGITEAVHTKDNMDGMDKTIEYMNTVDSGLIFTNLVEFDSAWGHRNDVAGYKKGLEAFDVRLKEVIELMTEQDLLIINADHGCDPTTDGTDHTREYVPVLIYGKDVKKNVNLGILDTFADIGQTIAEVLDSEKLPIGKSFLDKIRVGDNDENV